MSPVATGYDPLLDNKPELARSMAASVVQRIAFGERAGEKVRRIGSGFGYENGLNTKDCARRSSIPTVSRGEGFGTAGWGKRRMPQKDVLEHIELVGKEVLPAVHQL